MLHRQPRRKTFLQDPDEGDRIGISGSDDASGRVAMWDADNGTGAFYIIMDAVRQKIALRKQQQREMERKKDEGMEPEQ